MAFYSFITDYFKKAPIPKKTSYNERDIKPQLSVKAMMEELGVRTDSTIGTYEEEENPDTKTIADYINMQDNDGTVRAITRLVAMPIQASPIRIMPAKGDKGERDFIESVFMGTIKEGGMTTPLPFVIADMTRAIFEGYRLYEKVPQIITEGKYKGKIGWRKLAPRDSKTLHLRSDMRGGFLGAHQVATFGFKTVNINIPPEKCILFTFQKERHPFYGESLLKTAYYHYDKKHKLYYLAHKKAEIDAVGLKILKLSKPFSEQEVVKAEEATDSIGVNSRITLPQGFELDVDRSPTGYDVLKLIEHHDAQIALSTLTQAMKMGSGSTYNYPYGKGYETQTEFILQMIDSVKKNMEDTLNEWAVAPLIDWNFNSGSYPKIRLMPLKGKTQAYLINIFDSLMKKDPTFIPQIFTNKLVNEVADALGLEMKIDENKDAIKAFESGKKKVYDDAKIKAVKTPDVIKNKIKEKAVKLQDDVYFFEKFESMGRSFATHELEREKLKS